MPKFIYGDSNPNGLNGTDKTDYMFGYEGNDIISGAGGGDIIDGGTGADKMRGGTGDDTYYVDNKDDKVIENAGEGHDLVSSSISYGLAANVEDLLLTGYGDTDGIGNEEDNHIYGNSGDNHLYGFGGRDWLLGGGGNDHLYGGKGDDTLDGGTGADTMKGGLDNDTYYVNQAGDVIVENQGEGADYVHSSISYTLADNVEVLILEGQARIDGAGNQLTNILAGNSANNMLFGYAGDDIIDGHGGADSLWGGANNDTFVFHAGEANGDHVMDFHGNGGAAGDVLCFVGYGTLAQGTTFHQLNATEWVITSWDGAVSETITLSAGTTIDAYDMQFV